MQAKMFLSIKNLEEAGGRHLRLIGGLKKKKGKHKRHNRKNNDWPGRQNKLYREKGGEEEKSCPTKGYPQQKKPTGTDWPFWPNTQPERALKKKTG